MNYLTLILIGACVAVQGLKSKVQGLLKKVWWLLTVPLVCKWCNTTKRYAPLWFLSACPTHGICSECFQKVSGRRPGYKTKREIERKILAARGKQMIALMVLGEVLGMLLLVAAALFCWIAL